MALLGECLTVGECEERALLLLDRECLEYSRLSLAFIGTSVRFGSLLLN